MGAHRAALHHAGAAGHRSSAHRGNLHRRLTDGLEKLGATRVAIQNPAIDFRPAIDGHTYVPDVAVLDCADIEPGRNVARTCHLVAEIVSPSDRRPPSGENRQKIAIKIDGYEMLPTCEVILVVEQAAFDVAVATRTGNSWTQERFTTLDGTIAPPTAGVECRLSDVYAPTALMRADHAR